MTLPEVAKRCMKVNPKPSLEEGFTALCPLCDGDVRNLSVRDSGNGRWVIECRRGHTPEAIRSALGLTLEDHCISHVRARRKASDIATQEIEWLLYPYFAKGMLTGFDGDPGVGKSFIASAIAAAITQGVKLPHFEDRFPVGNALLYMTEDHTEAVTIPRLAKTFGADLDRIEIVDEQFALDAEGLARLERDIVESKALFVVLDPITAFIDAAMKRSRNPLDPHTVMGGLKDVAKRTNACIAGLRHLRKSSSQDSNALYSGTGDISIIGKYRTAFHIKKDPHFRPPPGPRRSRCIVSQVKSNIGPFGSSFGYEIEEISRTEAAFHWTGTVDVSADDMTNLKPEESRALGTAKKFLLDLLTNAFVTKEDVMALAKDEHGLSEKTVWRAKDALGIVKTSNHGFPDRKYRWSIPMPKAPVEVDPFEDE